MDCRVMSSFLLWLVVAVTKVASSPGRWVCPVNSQKRLTDDRVLLPLESITSSSEDTNNPTRNFINSHKWCSAEITNSMNIKEEYVGMNFTEPVVITMLVSGGLATSFVQNFSIHHTLSMTERDFQPYGELKSVQDFSVPKITFSDIYFTLETPILTKRLQFRISEGRIDPFDRICWSLLIHGCKQSEAYRINKEILPVETTHGPATPDASTDPTTTGTRLSSSSKQLILPTARQEGILQKDILLIVLPSAVVLIIIFLIIVTVGVMICLCYMKSPQLESPTYESVKLQLGSDRARTIVDGTTTPGSINLLYDQPRPQFYDIPKTSLQGHGSDRGSNSSLGSHMEITNPIYLGQKNIQELTNALCQLPLDDGNDYEDVLGSPMATLDRECRFKTARKTDFNQPPDLPNGTTTPKLGASRAVCRTPSLDGNAPTKYTKVNKVKQDMEEAEGRDNSSPIIKSHYMSTSVAITQELNRLTNELENSLKEQC